MTRHLIVGDFHIPFHDEQVLKLLNRLIPTAGVNQVIINGDFYDMYAISRFQKNPAKHNTLVYELDIGVPILENFKKLVVKKGIEPVIFKEGNHENRHQRKFWIDNPQYHGLKGFDFEHLSKLSDIKIPFVPAKQRLMLCDNMLIMHGHIVRKHSAYTAKAYMDRYHCNLICSHTHRGGIHYFTANETDYVAMENYCSCLRHDVEYDAGDGFPNWQHGFIIVDVDKRTGGFQLYPIQIVNNQFIFEGEIYK